MNEVLGYMLVQTDVVFPTEEKVIHCLLSVSQLRQCQLDSFLTRCFRNELAEWSPFRNGFLSLVTICSLCNLVILVVARFGFKGRISVLVVPVLCHCVNFTL